MDFPSRRNLLLGAGALLVTDTILASTARAATDWETITPKAAGFQPDLVSRFEALQASGRLAGVHGVVALRRGRIVLERYMTGTDDAWGKPLGKVTFGPDTLHDLRSVTKSVVGLLYGIALAAHQVPAPDQPLLAQFPEYPDLARDPQRTALTIGHALTMTMGMAWNEALPYASNPANSEIAMENAPDRYRYILDRPILGEPGRGWIYSGGAVALLGRLIEKGTGKDLESFAKAALFDPLGIGPIEWHKGHDGEASAASGLRLTPRDLARIGQVVLSHGQWNGNTIVPADWLEKSFRPAAMAMDGIHYGYLWYLGEVAITGKTGVYAQPLIAAFGNGGQRLFIFPDLDFVLVVTAGNYDAEDAWRPSSALLHEVFMSSLA
jgi:CubicO group peptidase (beta-lactamase class C family)